jgi:hypothetical protein
MAIYLYMFINFYAHVRRIHVFILLRLSTRYTSLRIFTPVYALCMSTYFYSHISMHDYILLGPYTYTCLYTTTIIYLYMFTEIYTLIPIHVYILLRPYSYFCVHACMPIYMLRNIQEEYESIREGGFTLQRRYTR